MIDSPRLNFYDCLCPLAGLPESTFPDILFSVDSPYLSVLAGFNDLF